jgi:3-deoxy-7-phosphoheptulonate synthase
VIVDPSHAPGRRDLVEPLSLAAAAAGADGIIVEVHSAPETAICDGPQQLHAADFAQYAEKLEAAAALAGKRSFIPSPGLRKQRVGSWGGAAYRATVKAAADARDYY